MIVDSWLNEKSNKKITLIKFWLVWNVEDDYDYSLDNRYSVLRFSGISTGIDTGIAFPIWDHPKIIFSTNFIQNLFFSDEMDCNKCRKNKRAT